MSRVLVVARHEFLVNLRRPGFIIMTLVVPLIGLVSLLAVSLLGGQLGETLERQFGGDSGPVGIVDQQGSFTPILPEYAERFRLYPSQEEGREAVLSGEIKLLLVITPEYLETGRVLALSSESEVQVGTIVDSTRTRNFILAHMLRGQADEAVIERITAPLNLERVALTGEGVTPSGPDAFVANALVPYFVGMMLVITIFTASGYLLQGITDEKGNRVMEIILSSVSARQMLAGKILGLGALGLVQVLFWLGTGGLLAGSALSLTGVAISFLTQPGLIALALVYFLLGFLLYATLMGAAGALGATQQESQQLAGIFSFIAAIPFFVAGFIITNPNMVIARILSWIPLTGATMMLLRLPMGGNLPLVDIVGSIVLLLLTVPFAIWAGAKVFRLGLLMYGKRPSLPEIWRALKEA